MIKLYIFIILIFLIPGCCKKSWVKFPILEKPDISFRTGSDGGYDVYIWKCFNRRRIAVFKFTSSFTCKEPEKQEVQCGTMTPIEKNLKSTTRKSVPENLEWKCN